MTIVLRPLAPTDAALLAALHRDWDEPWDERAFATLLATPGVFGLLAGDDQPLGFILCRIAADEAEVLTLFVAQARRRKGVATALIEDAISRLRDARTTALFLEVSAANAPARALYTRLGFTEVGRRPRYYRDGADALVLRRDVEGATVSRVDDGRGGRS